MNKKRIVILSIIGVLLIVVGIYFTGKTVATLDTTILKDQEVDSLSFTEADLKVNEGVSTYTVNVTNNNKEIYSLNYIEIKMVLEDDKEYTLIGYIGNSIDVGETKAITASIDKDLTNAKSLEYSINK